MTRSKHPHSSDLESFFASNGRKSTFITVRVLYALSYGGNACEYPPNKLCATSAESLFDCIEPNAWREHGTGDIFIRVREPTMKPETLALALQAAADTGDAEAAAYLPVFLAWMQRQRLH